MKITKITIQREKNLGDYESNRLELTAELNGDEDVDAEISKLQAKVNYHFGIIADQEKTDIFTKLDSFVHDRDPKTLLKDGLPFD